MTARRSLVLVALLVVAGCTPDDQPLGPSTPTRVDTSNIEVPRDRDENTVLASLRRLDPCSLLDTVALDAPVAPRPTAEDECRLDLAELGDHVSVVLGERFERDERYRSALLDLGGTKAYLDVSEPGTDSCRVAVPVSFQRVVSFVGRAGPRSTPGDICTLATSAATAAAPKLAGLGYAPDQPDQPVAGACVDYPFETECRPSSETEVPGDPHIVLEAAAAGPRVACALTGQALRTRLDPHLVPVVSGSSGAQAQCSFVEPTHTVLVDIVVAPNDSLDGDGEELRIAGCQAKATTSTGDRSAYHRLCALPVSGSSRGQLCLALTLLPGRGVENDASPGTARQSSLEPAFADVIRRYFA